MFTSRRIDLLLAAAAGTALLAASGAANAQFQERTIRAALVLPKEHSLGLALTQVAQCVAQKSGGKMKIQPFFDGSLGGDVATAQQLRSGSLEISVTAPSQFVGALPAAAVFDLPFYFANEKEADAVLDGKAGKLLADKLPGVGVVVLTYYENGFRNTTNSKHPINRMEDLKGLKLRVQGAPVILDTFKTLGGFPVPLGFTELYSALENRTVDGQENAIPIIESAKFYEVQKYLSMTRHMYNPAVMVYSKALFDKLSPIEQSTLRDCALSTRDEQRKINRQQAEEGIARMKAKGIIVNDISPAETARMREAVRPVHDTYIPAIGAEMMTAVQDDLKRVRGQ